MPLDDRVIAISATFTAEAIQPGLAFWAGELGLEYEIRFAAYNQLFQQLLDPGELFARNRAGFNVALVRFDDWHEAGAEEQAGRLVQAVHTASALPSAPLILVLCPPAPRNAGAFDGAERIVREGVADLPTVHTIPACEIESLYPAA